MRESVAGQGSMQAALPEAGTASCPQGNELSHWTRELLPRPLLAGSRLFRTGDWRSVLTFLLSDEVQISLSVRIQLIRRFLSIAAHIPCEHLQSEMLTFVRALLNLSANVKGCVVECGCYKGGGTAKLSIAAKLVGRELAVFDSFEGIPENREFHGNNIWGGPVAFRDGAYCGSFEEVATNVEKHGEIGSCRFVKGLFQDTLPALRNPVAVAYLDVDLAASTKTCLQYLWPLLSVGGVLFSHDGHLPLVLDVLRDKHFWREQFGSSVPKIHGLGKQKLIWMKKTAASNGD